MGRPTRLPAMFLYTVCDAPGTQTPPAGRPLSPHEKGEAFDAQRKPINIIALLLTFCLLMTAFSGTAIQTQAEELGISANANAQDLSRSTPMEFNFRHLYNAETVNLHRHYIASAVSFVDQLYSSKFSASFPSTGPISQDTVSDLNYCPLDSDVPCRNSSCGPYASHHRDVGVISNRLMNYRRNNFSNSSVYDSYIVVLWTDYDSTIYCYYHTPEGETAYIHEYVNWGACVIDHKPVIHIMNLSDSTTEQRIPHMSLLLAHELAHCFGAEDIYNNERPVEHRADGVWNCIVDCLETANGSSVEFYEDILYGDKEPFCNACRSAIDNGIDYWPNVA